MSENADHKTEIDQEQKPERPWPVVVTLRHPVEHGKLTIDTLTVRRGMLGDTRGIELGTTVKMDDLIKIAARMSGQTVEVINKLDADDAGEVIELAMDFYGRCLATGKTSSRR